MLRLTLRSAVAHWRRLVLTTFAVVLGVSFVIGSFVLSDSLGASINRLIDSSSGRVDLVVRPANADILSGPQDGIRSSIASELSKVVASVPGVKAVNTMVVGAAQIIDGTSTDAETGGPGRGIALVTSWPEHLDLTSSKITAGKAPTVDTDVAIDSTTASTKHIHVGDAMKIATVAGIADYTVSGIFEMPVSALPRSTLAFPLDRASALAGIPGRAARVAVQVRPGNDVGAIRTAIAKMLPTGVEVVTEQQVIDETKSQINQGLAIFTSVLLGFAAITLFVSTFMIWNTFNIVVAQRTRELALLRAVGASERQVAASIVGEGLVVGIVSSAIGVGTGIATAVGLRGLIGAVGAKLPDAGLVVAPRSISVGVAVGVLVTLFSVIGPARRSTSIAPVAAMQEATVSASKMTRRRTVLGLVAMAGGVGAGAAAIIASNADSSLRWTGLGVGAVLLFLSVASLSAHLVGPVLSRIGALPARLGSVPADLARRNAVRSPRRVASTAAALMVGLALVATTLVVGESIKNRLSGALTSSLPADLIVRAGGVVPFDAATEAKIAAVPGVTSSLTIGRVDAKVANDDNDESAVSVVDTSRILKFHDPDLTEGTLPSDRSGIAVVKTLADAHHLHPGSKVQIATATGRATLRVDGIYRRDELLDTAVVFPGALDSAGNAGANPTARYVLVRTGQRTAVASKITRVVADVPSAKVLTVDQFVADVTGDLDTVLAVIDAMLTLAVIVAALGIANTLALSIVERTRELGLLRAIGMNRRSMRRMVRIEGILLAVFGGLLGTLLGVAFGAAAVQVFPPNTALLTFPVTRLVMLVVAACLLGLIASILPARRAGKLAILDAIAVT